MPPNVPFTIGMLLPATIALMAAPPIMKVSIGAALMIGFIEPPAMM